jgi:hypothetical protein
MPLFLSFTNVLNAYTPWAYAASDAEGLPIASANFPLPTSLLAFVSTVTVVSQSRETHDQNVLFHNSKAELGGMCWEPFIAHALRSVSKVLRQDAQRIDKSKKAIPVTGRGGP